MPPDKDRLYVCLHARNVPPKMPDGEDRYHWTLLVAPKMESPKAIGMRFQAKDTLLADGQRQWLYEETEVRLGPSDSMLVRLAIGKVEHMETLVNILRSVPVTHTTSTWNGVVWVIDALKALRSDYRALGTRSLDWGVVRDEAMAYCQSKKQQHRFDGLGAFEMDKVPTYNLMEKRETVF